MQSSSAEVTMMESQNRKRAPAWTEREVRDLIAVWGEESVLSELRSSFRNAKTFVKISKGMKDAKELQHGSNRRAHSQVNTPPSLLRHIVTVKHWVSQLKNATLNAPNDLISMFTPLTEQIKLPVVSGPHIPRSVPLLNIPVSAVAKGEKENMIQEVLLVDCSTDIKRNI
ncbi:hypothetical protein UY3_07515 [Chelonia mydas]|uniref:Myb-like domain-containing protein n=1 Tax=Chelonia mydas TaxID=8469 RepID=M7BTE4_CHEMY|nr:hypothetical protein UY3_07515 [Chelonia mydas]